MVNFEGGLTSRERPCIARFTMSAPAAMLGAVTRWHCTRCGTTFDDPESDEEARAVAATFYDCEPHELDQEDIDTMGCPGCGYLSWCEPVAQPDETGTGRGCSI